MADYAKKNLTRSRTRRQARLLETRWRASRAPTSAASDRLALEGVKPGQRQAFGHRHEQDEEVYVVVEGSGRMRLGDDDDRGRARWTRSASRPASGASFEAGPEGLQVLAFGTHTEGDGEIDPGFWTD